MLIHLCKFLELGTGLDGHLPSFVEFKFVQEVLGQDFAGLEELHAGMAVDWEVYLGFEIKGGWLYFAVVADLIG